MNLRELEEQFLRFLEAHHLASGQVKDEDGNTVKCKMNKEGYWVTNVTEVHAH